MEGQTDNQAGKCHTNQHKGLGERFTMVQPLLHPLKPHLHTQYAAQRDGSNDFLQMLANAVLRPCNLWCDINQYCAFSV